MSIVEKLRDSLEYEMGCSVDFIAIALTGDRAYCEGTCACCRKEWAEKLADAIEAELSASKPAQLPEGIEWPQYEDGGFVMVGDEMSHIGGSKFVNAVAFKRDGAFITDERWKEFRFLPPFERYKPDTQEAINDDATMQPRTYYAKRIGHDVGLKDDAECTEAMVRDLLRRQRKLLGGD